MTSNLTVIIRSSGERTLSYCNSLLSLQIPEEQITIIKESPFSAALKKCLQIGIEKGCKWTLCIDADVLVKADAISSLLESADNADDNICEIQGLIVDKFFRIYRPAGNHLYRTSLMEKAIELIPEEGTSLRPESYMLNKMSAEGYPWQQVDLIVGLHDFKQNYSDIYKKCFLQAHKHTMYIPLLEPYWDSIKAEDDDFQVALSGIRAGMAYEKEVFVDRNFLNSETNNALASMGIKEKQPIPAEKFLSSFVEKNIEAQSRIASLHPELQDEMFPPKYWNRVHAIEEKKKKFQLIKSMKTVLNKFSSN